MPTKFKIQTSITKPNTSGRCSVRIRVCAGGRIDLYSGILLLPDQWNKNRQRVKQGCVVDGYPFNLLNDKIEKQDNNKHRVFIPKKIQGKQ